MVLFLPTTTTTTSDWNEDGRYSRDADGDGGQAEHRVRSSPPEAGKRTHPQGHARLLMLRVVHFGAETRTQSQVDVSTPSSRYNPKVVAMETGVHGDYGNDACVTLL